jgi:predicted ATPase/class 3 adenylate cyclase
MPHHLAMRRDLPSGRVTFLFTDIEGSTHLLDELGEERYAEALAEHRRVVREAFERCGGVEVDTQGDAFFVAFPTATGALEAAEDAQLALSRGPIRVRMGLHTGTPRLTDEGYVGSDVHKGARIAAAGHGGQVLLSRETRDLIDAAVTDLGEHRLKDFDEPQPIFQLGRERFPPLKTISNTNLPRPASSFVGRGREVAEVVSRLRDGTRLLTLTGPGGSGKTRLGIEAATELVPAFKAGVFWVGLAPLRDPALVTQEIARTIGAKDGLADHIGEREMLLLIDNVEQVIEAAPDLAALVEACPALRLLVSSRELLRVRGEVEYPVPPLAEREAVTLFCERSGLSAGSTIEELCARLDSLPLAVELAAARTKVLSPEQILERIGRRLDLFRGGRDADPRQATLRATIAWSYELLSPADRQLFERLSVFAGGCTLEAAEDVADADLDLLQSLVDKSLLRVTNERYWMLETIREFASERLAASADADAIERRHAGRFLALAEEAEPHLFSASAGAWHDRLEAELDNIRTALDTLEASGETEDVLLLAGSLGEFWAVKGHLTEGRRRIEHALEADRSPTTARAKALNAAADLATGSGDPATARARAEEGLALNRELGDRRGTADSLLLLGIHHIQAGDLTTAEDLIQRSATLFRELGDERNALDADRNLAWAYDGQGDLARARALNEDTIGRARALGDHQIEGRSLTSLAGYALDEGRSGEAVRLLEDAYLVNRACGDDYYAPIIVCRFGHALASEGKAAEAARVLSSGCSLLEEIGSSESWMAEEIEETRASALSELGETAFAEAWEQGRMLSVDEAVALALDVLR